MKKRFFPLPSPSSSWLEPASWWSQESRTSGGSQGQMQPGYTAEQRGGSPLKGHCQSLLASSGGHSLLLRAQRQVGHHQCRRGRKCHRILDQPLFTPREHHLTPAAHQVGSEGKKKAGRKGRGRKGWEWTFITLLLRPRRYIRYFAYNLSRWILTMFYKVLLNGLWSTYYHPHFNWWENRSIEMTWPA